MSEDRGIYLLFLKIEEDIELEIGSLGMQSLSKGSYIYVGSAFGPGGLEKRLYRHKRKEKKIFWHIDYLLNNENCRIKSIGKLYSDQKLECELNKAIHLLFQNDGLYPIKGFGSSDCKCQSHLLYIVIKSIENFSRTIKEESGYRIELEKV